VYFIFCLDFQALQQKTDFTDEEIEAFQLQADEFFSRWAALAGYDGVTNYIHMLGAGHIRYYLQKWRNLNRYSNQGWENYNKLVAAFWHHRTTRGGYKNILDRSKIRPIARWILRLMLWRTGVAQRYFTELEAQCDNPNEEEEYDSDDESYCN
jgi:hypothetical protein